MNKGLRIICFVPCRLCWCVWALKQYEYTGTDPHFSCFVASISNISLRDTIWAFGSWIHTNVFHVECLLLYAGLNRCCRGWWLETRYVVYTTTLHLHVTKSAVDAGDFLSVSIFTSCSICRFCHDASNSWRPTQRVAHWKSNVQWRRLARHWNNNSNYKRHT